MKYRLLCVAAYAIVCGCASVPGVKTEQLELARQSLARVDLSDPKIRSRTAVEAAMIPQETAKQDEALSTAFSEMLSACSSVLNTYDERAQSLSTTKIVIAAVGAVAGTVAIPALTAASAANSVWIAGLGGLAGVTNTAQQLMTEEGFTAKSVLETRRAILREWKSAIETYFDPDSGYENRRLSIQRGLAACSLYAITLPSTPVGEDKEKEANQPAKNPQQESS